MNLCLRASSGYEGLGGLVYVVVSSSEEASASSEDGGGVGKDAWAEMTMWRTGIDGAVEQTCVI